jgi:hypothetical protein
MIQPLPTKEWDYSPRYDAWYFWNPRTSTWILLGEKDFINEAEMISRARRIASKMVALV